MYIYIYMNLIGLVHISPNHIIYVATSSVEQYPTGGPAASNDAAHERGHVVLISGVDIGLAVADGNPWSFPKEHGYRFLRFLFQASCKI